MAMELSRPIAESLKDREGRTMVLRVNAARQYDASAMAASYRRGLDNYWELKGDRGFPCACPLCLPGLKVSPVFCIDP